MISEEEIEERKKFISKIHDDAIQSTGLSQSLCKLMNESIVDYLTIGDSQDLSWSYECLAGICQSIADRLSELE